MTVIVLTEETYRQPTRDLYRRRRVSHTYLEKFRGTYWKIIYIE